jgi:ribosome biogenesis GTPase A
MRQPGFPSPRALGLVDVFLFLADARIPWTCRKLAEPYLRKRKRVYILAKPDLADPALTATWLEAFKAMGEPVFAVNCHSGAGLPPVLDYLRLEKRRLDEKAGPGLYARPLRIMLFGTPNVGKSSLANRLLGNRKAPFGARPGLTRGSHWLKTGPGGFFTVLDTPGVLDTSQVKGEAKYKLASVWALRENAYDPEEVALWLASKIASDQEPLNSIEGFAASRGIVGPGGVLDIDKAYGMFIHAFREGQLGRVTLETPEEFPELSMPHDNWPE